MMRSVLFVTVILGAAVTPGSSMGPTPSATSGQVLSAFNNLSALLKPSSFRPDTPAYRSQAVERGDIVTTVQSAGTLNALVMVEVGSQLSGRVKELYVDFNSKVTKGQVIARVEPEIYEARLAQTLAEREMAQTQVSVQRAQIERARAEMETAAARYDSAAAQTARAEIALDGAAQEVNRKRSLAKQKIIAQGEWERDNTAHNSAKAQATAAQAEELSQSAAVRAAKATLNMAEAELANTLAQVKQKEAVLQQAQIDLDRTYVRAPVTGTVVNRAVSGGQTLAASLQTPILFTIAQDLTEMQVEASVVEADISRFALGQPVTFTADAYPDRIFTGTVKQIRKAPQVVQNVVTYIVVVGTENSDELLLPGMTANLSVVVAKRQGILKVPNAALRFRPRNDTGDEARSTAPAIAETGVEAGSPGEVFVVGPDGEPKLVSLRLGITDGRATEVLAGDLTEGQQVLTGFATAPRRDDDASSVLVKFRLR
ncbi:efflux RND transporter periplasmic adaptor subunit [Mesorhizobium sp.]|uniref:efflux RND transporter periplasmic adaptor subunit n=1 Tax=Mesorhizobium sp. TaxID=1871066 RepID=UPI000FE9EC3F|nr:efflux RND transporter periplasmic adaptor subunit [Mesorhizobium sp.]RWP31959.1 MAG: HlyD family efflux transporter periplasmic adaptor subunit [Mesorhizobium sp.]